MKMHCMDLPAEHTGYPDLFFGSAGESCSGSLEMRKKR